MVIERLTILGKSDAVITMILDNLESNGIFPTINIINNQKLPIIYDFNNPKFKINILETYDGDKPLILGVNKSVNKISVVKNFNLPITNYTNIINKSSIISSTTSLGYGCMVNSLVSIAAHTTIGNFVSINRNSSVGHHTIIGDYVTIQPGSNIAGHITIGEGTIIGMGSTIIDGITIGKNVVIGAGSLVTKNIPDNVVAYGSPCKIIRENETQSI